MIKLFILELLRFFDNYHQRKIFKFLKDKGYQSIDTFFDVGAHRGETIKSFTDALKIKKIYSFEASEINFKYLRTNIK